MDGSTDDEEGFNTPSSYQTRLMSTKMKSKAMLTDCEQLSWGSRPISFVHKFKLMSIEYFSFLRHLPSEKP